MKKTILAAILVLTMVVGLTACGKKASSSDTSKDSGSDMIKVGVINNDPNESGYRTANDKDMKKMFTKENGYDASFAYSLKNDEQIAAAQKLRTERYFDIAQDIKNKLANASSYPLLRKALAEGEIPLVEYTIEVSDLFDMRIKALEAERDYQQARIYYYALGE